MSQPLRLRPLPPDGLLEMIVGLAKVVEGRRE
jgi:hypothetical protein